MSAILRLARRLRYEHCMITLMLLRHAKSSWAESGLADLDRPLNERGKRDAIAMGRHMAGLGLVPQRVLCSPARRTRQTWKRVARQLGGAPQASFETSLYDFGDGSNLLDLIHQEGGPVQSLLLIGHNPAIGALATSLTGAGAPNLREELAMKYPTGALAVIVFDGKDWTGLRRHGGTLLRFDRPKELTEADRT
jgi:phosphohistidine phosphatase